MHATNINNIMLNLSITPKCRGVLKMKNVNILNEEYIRNIIKEANNLFKIHKLKEEIIPVALDLIIRYIKSSIPSEPREKEVLYT